MSNSVQIEWRDPTDDEMDQLSFPDDGSYGSAEGIGPWFLVFRDEAAGGLILGGSNHVSPSAWSTASDSDLSAAWLELTGQQLRTRHRARGVPARKDASDA